MEWGLGAAGFAVGVLIAVVTSPVGVSGAVFLLPVQLSVFAVPNPAVTPTNLSTTWSPDPAPCCATGATARCAGRWYGCWSWAPCPGWLLGTLATVLGGLYAIGTLL